MNTTVRLVALALGAGALAFPTMGAAQGDPAAQAPTHRPAAAHANHADNLEKGVVIECTSAAPALDAYVSMYDNSRYVNVLQVVIGDPDQGMGNSAESPTRFVRARQAFGQVDVGGEVATVTGSAVRTGPKSRVREEYDDAGQLIVTRGWHRRLRTDLSLAYGDVTVPLTCDTAFAYHLHVTRTPVAG